MTSSYRGACGRVVVMALGPWRRADQAPCLAVDPRMDFGKESSPVAGRSGTLLQSGVKPYLQATMRTYASASRTSFKTRFNGNDVAAVNSSMATTSCPSRRRDRIAAARKSVRSRDVDDTKTFTI